ncbi:hypothetical protein [Chitinimonas sp. BJYL2]|uniref:hypothetical protein n=1 Tax=Chitinimonas sp. BJYL2 TaxID=2976696 RepID=UPI0022B4F7C7|nr:hypothetical protein [Chitinimonas sp. BJYL2]
MRTPLILATLVAAATVQAADTPAPASPPPQWQHAIPVSVIVGADVASGLNAQAFPDSLLLEVKQLGKLRPAVTGAAQCVVDAEAWASLASERISVKPRRVRCFDSNGQELASRAVAGYAVDSDARTGVRGKLIWSATAKELLLLGVGAQAKQNFLVRTFKSALGRASMGLTDNLADDMGEKKLNVSGDAVREVRNIETLLPAIQIEAGQEFNLILHSSN